MAWSTPTSVTTGDLITAATFNQYTVSNPIALYGGTMSIASQAALDFVYATSATALARLAKGTGRQAPRLNSAASAYEFASLFPGAAYTATLAIVQNTTTETTTLSFVVPGGTWTSGEFIYIRFLAADKNNKGTSGTITYKFNAGDGAQVTLGGPTTWNNDATQYLRYYGLWLQRNTNDVLVYTVGTGGSPNLVAERSFVTDQTTNLYDGLSTPANFTADQTMAIKVTLSAADTNFYHQPLSAMVRHYIG